MIKWAGLAIRNLACLPHDANFILVSDGAFRKSTSKAAASWAVLAMSTQIIELVAAGAMTLPDVASSLDAELTGFELGLAALLKLSRGCECDPRWSELGLRCNLIFDKYSASDEDACISSR